MLQPSISGQKRESEPVSFSLSSPLLDVRIMPARIIIAHIFAFALLFAAQNTSGQVVRSENEAKAQKVINEESLLHDLNYLCDPLCQGRATGSQGNSVAAMWISGIFKNNGLVPVNNGSYFNFFRAVNGKYGRNVIGMLRSGGWYNNGKYVIVGAHYDHLGTIEGRFYPGADSNASGVVAMTSIARMMAWMRAHKATIRSNIIFVAFDAKEIERSGSSHMEKMLELGLFKDPNTGKKISKEDVTLMVNIDQIGCTSTPVEGGRKDYIVMLGNDSLPLFQRNYCKNVNAFSDTQLFLFLNYFGSSKFTDAMYKLSDQRAFIEAHIPSVVFTSGITMNTNKPTDTTDTIDLQVYKRRIWYIFHWLFRAI